jgi:hypothetical protein
MGRKFRGSIGMTIHVTQDHIDRGERGCNIHCALGLAIDEQCPGANFRAIEDGRVYFGLGCTSQLKTVQLPGWLRQWYTHFDNWTETDPEPDVAPIEFDLEIPS